MIRWLSIQRCKIKLHSAKVETRVEAVRRLVDLRVPDATKLFCNGLRDDDSRVRIAIVKGLGGIRSDHGIQLFVTSLADSDAAVRTTAANQLSTFGGATTVEPLITALGSNNCKVRETAAELLGKTGDPRAIDPLIRTLGDSDCTVRRVAAGMLSTIGGPRAVQSLIAALADGEVRQIAAKYLGNAGDARAINPLVVLLAHVTDSPAFLEETVAEALLKLSRLQPLESSVRARVEKILQKKKERATLSAKLRSSFPDSHGSSDKAMLSTLGSGYRDRPVAHIESTNKKVLSSLEKRDRDRFPVQSEITKLLREQLLGEKILLVAPRRRERTKIKRLFAWFTTFKGS